MKYRLDVSCITFLLVTTSLMWPHGIVKCPLNALSRILAEVVSHLFTFRSQILSTTNSYTFAILFFAYYIVGK